MQIIYETPIVTDKTSTGFDKFWQGIVGTEDNNFYTFSRTWQKNKSGEDCNIKGSIPSRVVGKSLGRSNATSDEQQAILEITSDFTKRNDKTISHYDKPMLCSNYYDGKKKQGILYSPFACGMIKLDGFALLMDNKRGAWTRGLKPLKNNRVIEHLVFDTKDIVVHGELMLPAGKHKLQATASAANKYNPDVSPLLEYHIYNCIVPKHPEMGFLDRRKILAEVLENAPPQVHKVRNYYMHSEAEYDKWHMEKVEEGHEGTVIYNANAPYRDGKHENLLKRKEYEDGEYVCVNIVEGSGSAENSAIFVLQLPDNGKEFNCNPMGKAEMRQQMFADKDRIIGKMVTIKYPRNQFTEDGCPKFANVIAVRDYE